MAKTKGKRTENTSSPKKAKRGAKSSPLRLLSLFSGGGGMDLGFEGGFTVVKECVSAQSYKKFVSKKDGSQQLLLKKTRFTTVFANDIFKDAKNCWVHHFSKRGHDPEVFRTESIVDLVKAHQQGKKVFPDNIDIVTGGFPCQDFSVAGLRNGFDSNKDHHGRKITADQPSIETRGTLYMWMKQVIEITQPKMFVAENVKGLINLGDLKDIIQRDFSTAGGNGYIVLPPQLLHAADYGVPQSRERVIFVGISKKHLNKSILKLLSTGSIPARLNPYPRATHAFTDTGRHLAKPVTLEKVFRLLVEPENSNDLSQQHYSKAKFMGLHCQGQTEVKLGSIGPTIRAEHHGNIEYRRHSFERGGSNFSELEQGLKERRLSVRECGMIQTFPLDYEFVIKQQIRANRFLVSPSQAYKVIGNAVPPLLAFNIAIRLQEIWNVYFGKKKNVSVNKPQTAKGGLRKPVKPNPQAGKRLSKSK
jgi:DNA (cytosine-5)-methyltransferase 1